MSNTLRKMNINFGKCQHLPSIIATFFLEFQHLPSIIVIFLMEFQHLATRIATFSINLTVTPSQALSQPTQPASQPPQPASPYIYILIRTCLKELSSEAINWIHPFVVRVYETHIFHCKNHAFWKPPSKTPRKSNIIRRPCQKHFVKWTLFFANVNTSHL